MMDAATLLTGLAGLAAATAVALGTTAGATRIRRLARAGPRVGARLVGPRVRSWLRLGPDSVSLRTRALAAAAGAALALVGAFRAGVGLLGAGAAALLSGAGLVVVLGWLEPGRIQRRRAMLVRDLPQALDLMAACLAAGAPLRVAARAVRDAFDGPVAEELGGVLALVELGVDEAEAWRTLRAHPQLGGLAADLARSVESGTRLQNTLSDRARDARAVRHAAVEAAAKAVGVRSVLPMMLCFLPAFLLLGIVPTVVSAFVSALPF